MKKNLIDEGIEQLENYLKEQKPQIDELAKIFKNYKGNDFIKLLEEWSDNFLEQEVKEDTNT